MPTLWQWIAFWTPEKLNTARVVFTMKHFLEFRSSAQAIHNIMFLTCQQLDSEILVTAPTLIAFFVLNFKDIEQTSWNSTTWTHTRSLMTASESCRKNAKSSRSDKHQSGISKTIRWTDNLNSYKQWPRSMFAGALEQLCMHTNSPRQNPGTPKP
jgi:hypothetical protein